MGNDSSPVIWCGWRNKIHRNRSVIPVDMIFPFLAHGIKGTLADTGLPRLFPQLPLVAAVQPGPVGRDYLPGLAAVGLLLLVPAAQLNTPAGRVASGKSLVLPFNSGKVHPLPTSGSSGKASSIITSFWFEESFVSGLFGALDPDERGSDPVAWVCGMIRMVMSGPVHVGEMLIYDH